MANYSSIPRRFNPPTSSINHQYIDTVLRDKQDTINQNFGIMSQSVEQVLGQDLIRPEDREYLKDKVSNVLNALDNTDSVRFDSKKSRFFIQDALSEAAKDPEVLRQVANTKKIKQVQQFYQDRAKKGDLNQQNFQYAYQKSGINDYLSGKVDSVGEFQYLEYTDVDKKLTDVSKDLQAMKPDTEIKVPDGQGGVYSKKVSQLTQSEWIARLNSSLDANDRAQIQINGAAMYGFNDQAAVQDLENKKLEAIQPNLTVIEDLKSKLPLVDEATKLKYNTQIADLDALNKQTLANFDKIGKTADSIGGYYMQNAMINNMAAFMSKSTELTYEGADEAYFKNKKAAEEKTGKITDVSGREIIDYTGDAVSDIQSNVIPKEFSEQQKKINYENVFMDSLKQTENAINVEVQSIYNRIEDPEVKRNIDTYRQQRFKETGNNSQALTDAIVKYSNSDALNMSLSEKESLLKKISQSEAMYSAINNSSNKAIEVALEPNRIFEEIYNNDTNIRIHGVDSNITFRQYLQGKGVNNKEQFSSFMKSDESAQLRASLLLQSDEDIDFVNVGGSYREGTENVQPVLKVDKESRIRFSEIEKLTGEKLQVEYDGKVTNLANVPNNKSVRILNNASSPNSFLGKGIQAIKAGGNSYGPDRIVSEDGDLMKYLGNSSLKSNYDSELNIQGARIPGSSAITIQGATQASKQSALKNELEGITNQKFSPNSNIVLIKKSPTEYAIFETQLVTRKDGDEETTSYKTDFTTPKGTVTIDALRGAQQGLLYNAINFEEAEKNIEFALDRKWKSPPINYKKASVDTEKQLIEYLGPNNPLAIYASKESFLNKVKQTYKNETATAVAKTILDNSNKFQINFESARVGQNGGIGKLNIELNNGEVLYSMPVQRANVANYLKYSQVIPEAFLSLAAENIIENKDNEAWAKITRAIE